MSPDELTNRVFEHVPVTMDFKAMGRQPTLVDRKWRGLTDPALAQPYQGWHPLPVTSLPVTSADRSAPMQHPEAVVAWMKDGSGNYQAIGYGGEEWRWNARDCYTPYGTGTDSGFWVRNQRKLDRRFLEELEAARAASRASQSRGGWGGWGTWDTTQPESPSYSPQASPPSTP